MAKVGRPKVKMSDLPDGWQDKALALAKQGASEVEIRCEAFQGMTNKNGEEIPNYVMSDDLWYRLIEEEPIFSRTIKDCSRFCRQWWEKNGRENLKDKDFSATLWYMNMKNRFGWRDKQDFTTNGKELPAPIMNLD